MISGDLTTAYPYTGSRGGFAGGELGAARRILISDHLCSCAVGVELSLIEAGLHFLGYADCVGKDDDFSCVRLVSGYPEIRLPRRDCSVDDLRHRLVELHAAGVFRALAGTLECVAAVIAGWPHR